MNNARQLTVLVVEDQEDLRNLLVATLTRLGHFRVNSAEDGVYGLESVFIDAPDCIIADVLMPRLNGFQFVQALRGDPSTAHIPIIMLTALAQQENQFRGMAFGADYYILKPARPLELVQVVREALHISETDRAARMKRLADSF